MLNTIKNISLFSLFTVLLSGTSFAASLADRFYIKSIIGLNKMQRIDNKKTNMQESVVSPAIGVGIGYNLTDSTRAELVIYYTKLNFKASKGNNIPCVIYTNVGHVHMNSVMIGIYRDLYQTNNIRFFVGGELGYARIHEKVSHRVIINRTTTVLMGRKLTHNMAYSLTAGTSIQMTDNVMMELSYSWKDYGKTAERKINTKYSFLAKDYKGHVTTIGIRYYM